MRPETFRRELTALEVRMNTIRGPVLHDDEEDPEAGRLERTMESLRLARAQVAEAISLARQATAALQEVLNG